MEILKKKWAQEIEKAKQEVIKENTIAWQQEYLRLNKSVQVAPEPSLSEVTPEAWFTAVWETGFVVCDYQKLLKLPKRQREKILALGGI